MPNLVWYPTIHAIGQTQWNINEFESWMGHNYLDEHFDADTNTPLSRLWEDVFDRHAIERMIEFGGRHCYRAWEKGRDRSDYIKNIIDMEHGSVLEHSTINWAIQGVSRSLSLELSRHRVGIALSQESQRYVDAKDIEFVVPPMVSWLNNGQFGTSAVRDDFESQCVNARDDYATLQHAIMARLVKREASTKSRTMQKKRANEAARAHLPNACETRFLWSTNMRLLRHFIWLRGGSGADLEIRRLAVMLLDKASEIAPSVFADMTTKHVDGCYGVPIVVSND